MLGGGPFELPRGAWSDDTAMALCLAESLLEQDRFDARDQVERYRRWQQEGYLSATEQCVGITAGTARALARAQWRRQVFSGSHDPQAQDPETLSRVTPVVLFFFADVEQAAHQAGEAARTTCQSPQVLAACRAFGARRCTPRSAVPPRLRSWRPRAPGDRRCRTRGAGRCAQRRAGPRRSLEGVRGDGHLPRSGAGGGQPGRRLGRGRRACGALAGCPLHLQCHPSFVAQQPDEAPTLLEEFADRLLAHALVELAG